MTTEKHTSKTFSLVTIFPLTSAHSYFFLSFQNRTVGWGPNLSQVNLGIAQLALVWEDFDCLFWLARPKMFI